MATLRDLVPGLDQSLAGLVPGSGPSPVQQGLRGPATALIEDEAEAAGMGQLRRGFTTGRLQADANALAADESAARAAGDTAAADALRLRIGGLQQRSKTFAPAEQDVTQLDWQPGRILDYGLATMGQGAASMTDPLAVGVGANAAAGVLGLIPHPLAQGGAKALRAGGILGGGYLNYRQNKGEFYNQAVEDPALMAGRTAQEIDRAGAGHGLVAGALDTALPAWAASRIIPGGPKVLAGLGSGAKAALGLAGEGATETLQGESKRGILGHLNPERDTSGDTAERWNDFVGGVVGAGPIVGLGHLGDKATARLGVKDDTSGDDVSGTKVLPGAPKRENLTDSLKRSAAKFTDDDAAEKWNDTLQGLHNPDQEVATTEQHAALLKELSGRAAKGDTVAQQHIDALNKLDPADNAKWFGAPERDAAYEHILGDGTDHEKVIEAYKGRKLNAQGGGDKATVRLAADILSSSLPEGAHEGLHAEAKDIARSLASFADVAEGRGKLHDPLKALEVAQRIADVFPGKTAAALVAKVATAIGVETTPLFKQLQQNLAGAADIANAKKSGRTSRAAVGEQLVALIPASKQLALRKEGIDLTSPSYKAALVDTLQRFGDRKPIEFNKAFGVEATKAMLELVAPGKVVEKDTTAPKESGGEKTAPAKESDRQDNGLGDDLEMDDFEVDAALKNIEKAPGTKLYAFKGRGLIGSTEGPHPFVASKKTGNLPVLSKLDDTNHDGTNTLEHAKAQMYEALGGEFGPKTVVTRKDGVTRRTTANQMSAVPSAESGALGVGSYRIRTASAREVLDGHGVPPSKRVQLMLQYLAKDNVKHDGTANSLRDKLGVDVPEDATVTQMADAYFSARHLVTAEQMAEKDQLRLDHSEVKRMARRGNDDLDYSDLGKADGSQARLQAGMNLIRFKSKHAVAKDGVAVMRAGDLVLWVFKNRNEYKRDRNKGGAEVRAHEYRDALSEAIGALVADGFADELPYVLTATGKKESFADGFPPSLKLGGLTQADLTRGAQERAAVLAAKKDKPKAISEKVRQERVARDQNKTETVRNTDPDELLDEGTEAKRPARLDEDGEALPQDAARYWDAPRTETKDELARRTVGGKDAKGNTLRVPKYPTAPETVETRSDAMRVPSELEQDEQAKGVPTERTDLAQRTAVLGTAEAGLTTLTPANAVRKGQRLAEEVWAQFGTDSRGAFLRLQRLVAALERPADPEGNALAGGRHYAAPLALILTPANVKVLISKAQNKAAAGPHLERMRDKVALALLTAGDNDLSLAGRVVAARALLGNEKLSSVTMKAPLQVMADRENERLKDEQSRAAQRAEAQKAKVAAVQQKRGAQPLVAKPEATAPKVKLTGTSVYLAKDQAKADKANKFIGRGSESSSTAQYAKDFGPAANTGAYTSTDRVFVSAEGKRDGRVNPDRAELDKAVAAGVTFITDDAPNRERGYNVGERQIAKYLTENGYTEVAPGEWTKAAQVEAPAPKLNAQATETQSTDAGVAEAIAYLKKTRGPEIMVEVSKDFPNAGEYLEAERLIKLSTAIGPGILSVAYHEGLHDAWATVLKNHPGAREALSKVMSSPAMLARLQAMLANEPEALAAITTGPHAAEERVAYAYQFWAAGELDVDKPATTLFAKFRKMLRKVLGMVRESETALDIMTALHEGKLAEPSAAGRVLGEIMARETWNADVKRRFDAVVQNTFAAVAPSNDVLRRENLSGTAQLLGRILFSNPGEETAGDGQGYLNARKQKISQYTNYLHAALKGLSERDLADVAKQLQLKTPLENIAYAPVRDAVEGVRALTKRYYEYATQKSPHGEPVLKLEYLGDDHYPRVWDLEQLIGEGGRDKFIAMLMQPKYAKAMGAALTMANEGRPTQVTAQQVAEMMYERLVEKNGVDDKAAESDRADDDLLDPFFASQKERSFKWLDDADVEPFLEKDVVGAMSRYLHQGIRAVEFSRRFGEHGKFLRPLMIMKDDPVLNPETGKVEPSPTHGRIASEMHASLKKAGTTGAEADAIVARHMDDVRKAVAAHEGSLGHTIGPTWRKFSSAAMAYQNLRLLPLSLFAAFGDTIGIAARYGDGGGKMAFQAFTQGLRDVYARWKDAASDMPAERTKTMWENIAEMVGAVDSHMFLEQMGKAHTSEFTTDWARKANRALFMANGLTAWDRSMRVSATKSAVLFLQHHAAEPDKQHSTRWLKELGLKAADIPLDADGNLIYDRHVLAAAKNLSLEEATKRAEKIHFAITRWVEGAILTPTAGQRPTWASDPHYAVLFHLKQFTYSFHHTILKRAYTEAGHGNMGPLGALMAAVPTMVAADLVKGVVLGGGSLPAYMQNWSLGDHMLHGVSRAGLGGIGQFGIDGLRDPTSLLGPTAQQAGDFILNPLDLGHNLHNAVPGLRMVKGLPDLARVAE